MPANKTSANKNISRVDTRATHGYQVRMRRRRVSFDKFFSDKKFGGKRKALLAARDYRDELAANNRAFSRKETAALKDAPASSGVPGVRLEEKTVVSGEYETTYSFWVAQWSPEPGVRKTRRFSVDKHGDEGAFKKAVNARRRGVREMVELDD